MNMGPQKLPSCHFSFEISDTASYFCCYIFALGVMPGSEDESMDSREEDRGVDV
jgi:hypothetical protein